MDTFFRTETQRVLDEEIKRLVELLSIIDPAHEDYPKISAQLKVLCEAREKKDPSTISRETVLAIAANLIGLVLILNFERTGVITTKAMGWLWKK